MPSSNEIVIDWLQSQYSIPGFQAFLKMITDKHKSRTDAAVDRGDTEFEKGEASALKWVKNLPDELMKSAKIQTDG